LNELNIKKTLLHKSKGEPRKVWSFVNSLTGKHRLNIDEIIHKYMNNKPMEDVADAFNDNFIDNVKSKLHICNTKFIASNRYNCNKLMLLPQINMMDIKEIIKSLNIQKAPGFDKITVRDIIMGGEELLKILIDIINKSIKKSVYPDRIKLSIIRPIYKTGKHLDLIIMDQLLCCQ
jgi:hypothetical protein